jgi:hypothetical protein
MSKKRSFYARRKACIEVSLNNSMQRSFLGGQAVKFSANIGHAA